MKDQQHEQHIKKLEGLISNFDETTTKTKDKFMTVATSYLKKIDTDNQEQDFNKALNIKFKDITNKLETLEKTIRHQSEETSKYLGEYDKTVKAKTKANDNVLDSLNKSLKFLVKGVTNLLFVIILISLVMVVAGPIGDYFGIQKMYDVIAHVIKTGDSAWRYLMLLLYLVPYVLFGLIIFGIVRIIDAIN